jgi:arabinofuranosyltransferase
MAGAAYVVAGTVLARSGRPVARVLPGLAIFVGIVAAHFAFRLVYYGEWLPNTYYAKAVGARRWGLGLAHLGAFVLEYATWLWVPALIAAALRHARAGTGYVPALFAAVTIPHLLYIASIGGDHFEYRPQDLLFPFAYCLVAEGTAAMFRARGRTPAAAAYLAAVLLGAWYLPWRSHVEAPTHYAGGFPGPSAGDPASAAFLDPERSWVTRLPGLRAMARAHRALLHETTLHFVGIRQEDHAMFLEKVRPEAERLRDLVHAGILPPDAHLATSCVGLIGWESDLRVFDRHGLTDAGVAHSRVTDPRGKVAHEKRATLEDARERGVELWAFDPVHSVWKADDPAFANLVLLASARGIPAYAAQVGDDDFLLVMLPLGLEHVAARFPRLALRPVADLELR